MSITKLPRVSSTTNHPRVTSEDFEALLDIYHEVAAIGQATNALREKLKIIPHKLPRVSSTVNHHPMQVIDMQNAQDVVEAIKNMSMAELHALRVSKNAMDEKRFFKIINEAVNRMNAKVE